MSIQELTSGNGVEIEYILGEANGVRLNDAKLATTGVKGSAVAKSTTDWIAPVRLF
jgi:hypothetical protein